MNNSIGLDSLSAKQCECLELVLKRKTSKQIAIELGISRYTVDQRLDIARRRLGAEDRQEAASIYAGLKEGIQAFVYDESSQPSPSSVSAQPPSMNDTVCDGQIPEQSVYEPLDMDQPAERSQDGSASEEDRHLLFSEPSTASDLANGDSPMSKRITQAVGHRDQIFRLFLICSFATVIMIMFLLAVAVADGMTRIFHPH